MRPLLAYQYEEIEAQAGLLELHATAPHCACHKDPEPTNCPRKHALLLAALARETEAMLPPGPERDALTRLSVEAAEWRATAELEGPDLPAPRKLELERWARAWRKAAESALAGRHRTAPCKGGRCKGLALSPSKGSNPHHGG